MATGPAWALDQEAPACPDGLPRGAPGHPWKIFNGARYADSLSYPLGVVFPAASRQLVTDQWQIYHVDPARGVIVSKWKALQHPLASYFMGKVTMRCVVHIEPLGRNRSRIIFRADLASREPLTGNPMFGEAKRSYSMAARGYLIKVRQYLYDHRPRVRPPGAGP